MSDRTDLMLKAAGNVAKRQIDAVEKKVDGLTELVMRSLTDPAHVDVKTDVAAPSVTVTNAVNPTPIENRVSLPEMVVKNAFAPQVSVAPADVQFTAPEVVVNVDLQPLVDLLGALGKRMLAMEQRLDAGLRANAELTRALVDRPKRSIRIVHDGDVSTVEEQ